MTATGWSKLTQAEAAEVRADVLLDVGTELIGLCAEHGNADEELAAECPCDVAAELRDMADKGMAGADPGPAPRRTAIRKEPAPDGRWRVRWHENGQLRRRTFRTGPDAERFMRHLADGGDPR